VGEERNGGYDSRRRQWDGRGMARAGHDKKKRTLFT